MFHGMGPRGRRVGERLVIVDQSRKVSGKNSPQ